MTTHYNTDRTMSAIDHAWQTISPEERASAQAQAREEWAAVERSGDIHAMTEWLDANRARLSGPDHLAACERICRRDP